MAVKKTKELILGIIFTLIFFILLFIMFQPYFGKGQNFLAYSDDLFNQLAKGSAYFIPKLKKDVEKFRGQNIEITIDLKRPTDTPKDTAERLELAKKLYTTIGVTAEIKDETKLFIKGDLGQILTAALEDADAFYWNKGEIIKEKYKFDNEKRMFRQWHNTLSAIHKKLTLEKQVTQANIINTVVTKAIEPAYNFYGVTPQSVKQRAGVLTALLIFYVFYTVWWGFAIMYLMEGFGLSTKKAKVKKEV
ncbi:MAG: hypothetical protein N2Z40_05045 [Caldimicrobium sp.]|nr:hypothetical protein [Caldimicrobium sp.]MCX7613567.1 hypothetical protein [Caldimicrobium sp.]MDW8182327.1 hypothetical protein [Caldimicrobium sp.]